MFESLGTMKFRLVDGIVSFAICLQTGKVYEFKEANKYYRMYKEMQ